MTIPEAHQQRPAAPPLDTLVVTLTPRLRGYLNRFALDPQDREDILQDVWMLYLLHRHRILDHDRTAAWLRTTASRQAIRTCTDARRERVDQNVVEQNLVDTTGPAHQTALAAQRQAVRRAVARLPERDRRLAGLMATRPELTYA
ncbi:MAG: sigma-70 family RNA polymerase sigma factor, partial [Thermocrispum sp.]